jgi:hypothetical protein
MTFLERKDQAVIPATALLCQITPRGGATLYWATTPCVHGALSYSARISTEQKNEWRFSADLAAESAANVQILAANADGAVSELRRSGALKGARIKLFGAVLSGANVEDAYALFTGIIDNVVEASSRTAKIIALSRLSAVRSSFPPMRIQKQCSWAFPKNEAERAAALSSGEDGRYSPLFRCGYSAGIAGGFGNLDGDTPFTSCDYTRVSCEARGMFDKDSAGQTTRRFSGIEFVPPAIQVRGHGESSGRLSSLVSLDTRYNDVVPAIYGMGWMQAPVVFSRNDGNLTRSEVLLGLGEIEDVVKVLVNGFEIPRAVDGTNMTGTGWFQVVTTGGRTGGFNMNFTDGAGVPQGDPYGSLAYLSVVVPNKVSDGKSTPKVEVLLRGIRLPVLDASGALVSTGWSTNPAWILCDILRRCGWGLDELNLASFVDAAAYCDAAVTHLDANGNARTGKRFEVNLVLRRRYTLVELLRGIRLASLLRLGIDAEGRLYLRPESTLAQQQPAKPAGSNAEDALLGGWAAYEFDDGKYGRHGICLKANGEPEFEFTSKPSHDAPNHVSAEIQDALNEFRQDSFSLADTDDIAERRQEIQQTLPVLGLPNLPQAIRVGQTWLNKSIAGNAYVGFRTSLRGVHLRPGDLISVTYEKHGFDKTLFRVLECSIGASLDSVGIVAQLHQDHWYSDDPRVRYDRRRIYAWANRSARAILPLEASESIDFDENGFEKAALRIPFVRPVSPEVGLAVPLVSFQYSIASTGGNLSPGNYYYGFTSVSAAGAESALSTLVPVHIESSGANHVVTLQGLSFNGSAASMNVYRGTSPYRLMRIASAAALGSQFIDEGSVPQSVLPPDANYKQLRSYFRRQYLPSQSADTFSANSIGNSGLSLTSDEWAGKTIVIRGGKGQGQERRIVSHTASVFTLESPWQTSPDATSQFAVVHTEWTAAQASESSEIVVYLPLLSTETFEVNLRSVDANGDELESFESPSVLWQIGVGGSGSGDTGVPPEPSFGFRLLEGGTISIGGFAFSQFSNLSSAYAAKLGLLYWDELTAPTALSLSANATEAAASLFVDGLVQPLEDGDYLQIGQELLRVVERVGATNEYVVVRGSHLSPAAGHAAGAPIFKLERRDEVINVLPGLLTSTAGARFRYNTRFPYVRIAAAELSIYNRLGGGAVRQECYTQQEGDGVRTLSGGQIAFSVGGYLAIEASAASPYITEREMAVGDVSAAVVEAPGGAPVEILVRVDGTEYASLTIAAGSFTSAPLSRFNHPPIPAGATITFDITSVPPAALGSPGRDLTVFLQV